MALKGCHYSSATTGSPDESFLLLGRCQSSASLEYGERSGIERLQQAATKRRETIGTWCWRLGTKGIAEMADLKLAKLPDRTPVKLTISVSPDLHGALTAYAALYAETYGREEPVAELIPAMLASFLESDRALALSRIKS